MRRDEPHDQRGDFLKRPEGRAGRTAARGPPRADDPATGPALRPRDGYPSTGTTSAAGACHPAGPSHFASAGNQRTAITAALPGRAAAGDAAPPAFQRLATATQRECAKIAIAVSCQAREKMHRSDGSELAIMRHSAAANSPSIGVTDSSIYSYSS